jgi:pyrophosphatase PpaX
MSNPLRRAVLFDLDGTLVDTIELLLNSVRHAFAGRPGRGPTTAEWMAGIGTPLATQLEPWASDESDLRTLVESYRSYQRANHDQLTRCYENVLPTIQRLDELGYPMAVVTSKANDIALRSVVHVGLDRYLRVIVGVESTARHKPDPEPVRYAVERLGARLADAVFVGDSPHDVVAGNAAGVTTVGALWGPFSRATLEAVKPRYLLDRIGGLPALLESLPVPAAA